MRVATIRLPFHSSRLDNFGFTRLSGVREGGRTALQEVDAVQVLRLLRLSFSGERCLLLALIYQRYIDKKLYMCDVLEGVHPKMKSYSILL